MAARRPIWVDTSAFVAWFDRTEKRHKKTDALITGFARAGTAMITSDYIVDETCTLLKARGDAHAALRFLDLLDRSAAFRLEWVGSLRFDLTRQFFRKHSDHGYSFTDCTSFVLMRELRLKDALTTDSHFIEAGFHALLID